MRTRTKLNFGFGLLVVLFLTTGTLTVVRFQSLQNDIGGKAVHARERRNEASLVAINLSGFNLAVRNYLQTGDPQFLDEIHENADATDEHLKRYAEHVTDHEWDYVRRLETDWPAYRARWEKYLKTPAVSPAREEVLALALEQNRLDDFISQEILTDATDEQLHYREIYIQTFENIVGTALAMLFGAGLVAGITAWVVSRGILRTERDLLASRERFRVTLASIGDAVITTDAVGRVIFLNPEAEKLTGWAQHEAYGKSLPDVFHIINESTRKPAADPALRALKEGVTVGLANHTLLIGKDGIERPIDDSAAPIRNEKGEVDGVVLVFRDITERKKAEGDSAHLAAIVTSSHDAILSLDLAGNVRSWNEGARQLYGYEADEIVGEPVTRLIPEDRHDEEDEILQRIASGERIDNYETVRVHKDGTEIGVALTVSPLRAADGTIIGASKIARDITERIRAKKELEEGAARFQVLFETSPVGMFLLDKDLRVQLVNQRALPTLGDIPNLVGGTLKNITDHMMTPDVAEPILAQFRQTLETGEAYDVPEFGLDRTDRKRREYFNWQIVRTTLPNGEFGIVCSFIEITDFVRVRTAMQQSTLRFRRLFESAYDGILIVDVDTGRVVDANANLAAMAGREVAEMIGRTLPEVGLAENDEDAARQFERLRGAGYLRQEKELHAPGAVPIIAEVVATAHHEESRIVAQFNVRDMSGRAELERRVKEQAARIADESRRKDEFLAVLSHELRNPLAPIRSGVYLLKSQAQGDDNSVQRQALEIIDRQVNNMTKLVNDLLEVSRVISGRIRLNLQPLNLREVIDHAIEAATPLIAERRHDLRVNNCAGDMWVQGDSTRIEEILMNLLSNAAKYTEEGGRIEVSCGLSRSGEFAEVRVRDNGVGIEPDMLPHIFDLFTQSDRSLARSAGGLGVGLNLAHRLARMHGGEIEAHSPPPGETQGSEFMLRLPLAPAPSDVTAETSNGSNGRDSTCRRVLVVDDNVDQVTLLVSGLRGKGYAVQAAHNGHDGLKACLQWRPDVVLLDIGLPGMNGYEVARRVRSACEDTLLPKLVALTGYGQDADVALAKEAGFDVHLTKPCEFEQLHRVLQELDC